MFIAPIVVKLMKKKISPFEIFCGFWYKLHYYANFVGVFASGLKQLIIL